jgi:hypothetical protein
MKRGAKATVSRTSKKPPRATARKAPAKRRKAAATPTQAVPPQPGQPRHAVFVDVENTNSEQALFDVLDALQIDRGTRTTELVAVGNWRAVGQQLGRRLGALGAQLVHSAPARGVRDWSDLWIAVAAGCWLGQSKPGDVLEIVSNDRAFDAVGDAAASRGVMYRRLQHKRDVAAPEKSEEPKPTRARRSRGGRRRRRGHAAPTATATPVVSAAPSTSTPAAGEPHAATREQVIETIGRLTNNQAGRWINLDVLEKTLKAQGFSRPPGSPRLVTRLRALKDLEVDSHGRVRLTTDAPSA